MKIKHCPSDEIIACFAEGLLSAQQLKEVEQHINNCDLCREVAALQIDCVQKRKNGQLSEAPPSLIESIQELIPQAKEYPILQVLVKFRDRCIESLITSGEVLIGPTWQPAYQLRSSKVSKIETIIVRQHFNNLRVVVEVSPSTGGRYNVSVTVEGTTQPDIGQQRVTLFEGDVELESHVTLQGKVLFEGLKEGHYRFMVSHPEKTIGEIDFHLKNS